MRRLFLIGCLFVLLAPLTSPVPALQLAGTTVGETPEACSSTFCMRCADLCCPLPNGGCVCCSGD